MIEGMERMGWELTHVYGLTEVYGPATVCAKHDEWKDLDIGKRTERNGRQGVRYLMEEGLTVMDPEHDEGRCPPTARPWARSCSAATSP